MTHKLSFLFLATLFFGACACFQGSQQKQIQSLHAVENLESPPSDTILVDSVVVQNLAHTYKSTDRELPFCLFGKKNGRKYKVTGLRFPEIKKSEKNMTRYSAKSCEKQENFLGMVHNHSLTCLPSNTDLSTFIRSENEILLIWCETQNKLIGITRSVFD